MSSVGIFRTEELDGKPYLVFTLAQTTDQTPSDDALAMDSGGDDLPLEPLFFCPAARIKYLEFKLKKYGDDDNGGFQPFNSSPHSPNTRNGDQQGGSLLDCDHPGVCKLPVVPLFWCDNKPNDSKFSWLTRDKSECGACELAMPGISYYACLQCQGKFHKECVEAPVEFKHPLHPLHFLRLCIFPTSSQVCICCEKNIYDMFYHCTTCELYMHPVCAMRPVPFVIDHPKSHPHPLTIFPTQTSTICHICAQIDKFDPTYICIQCVFVIHKSCIGLPHVIRISRHPHRISFTYSLPSEKLSCGVCHQQVDNDYGAYSCTKCISYFVHSKCALHGNVWDGIDLDGVPEENDKIDDGEPFERIADGIIRHPFHSHHLRLEITEAYDESKYCRGCALPIYEGQFYSCMECDFILHDSCAYAPRMKRHPLYPHPLTLNAGPTGHGGDEGIFQCRACARQGTGFFYEHHVEAESFKLDIRCASIIEPFEYQGHKHPLFLPWDLKEKTKCQTCKFESNDSKLICLECDYIICFCCATFPYKTRYKHDSHFLTICDGKEASDQPDWCEICESKIEEVEQTRYQKKERRLYKCNDCCTTLHAECLLGKDIYMKPGKTKEDYISFSFFESEISRNYKDVRVHLNNSLSRPSCMLCMIRCPFPIVFKGFNTVFCSWECLRVATFRVFISSLVN